MYPPLRHIPDIHVPLVRLVKQSMKIYIYEYAGNNLNFGSYKRSAENWDEKKHSGYRLEHYMYRSLLKDHQLLTANLSEADFMAVQVFPSDIARGRKNRRVLAPDNLLLNASVKALEYGTREGFSGKYIIINGHDCGKNYCGRFAAHIFHGRDIWLVNSADAGPEPLQNWQTMSRVTWPWIARHSYSKGPRPILWKPYVDIASTGYVYGMQDSLQSGWTHANRSHLLYFCGGMHAGRQVFIPMLQMIAFEANVVIKNSSCSNTYFKTSTFCLHLRGHMSGWTGRLGLALEHGCIPVVFSDEHLGHFLPYYSMLDWGGIAVILPISQVASTYSILASITSKEIIAYRENIGLMRQTFHYPNRNATGSSTTLSAYNMALIELYLRKVCKKSDF